MSTPTARKLRRWAIAALAACSMVAAQAHGGGRWSVNVDLGLPIAALAVGAVVGTLPVGAVGVHYGGGRHGYGGPRHWHHGGVWYRPWGPSWMVVAPPIGYVLADPAPVYEAPPPLPAAPPRRDPVIVPRDGQSPQQTEADRQACNRWATTQPAALADAQVFHRAVMSCMDERGYTMQQ